MGTGSDYKTSFSVIRIIAEKFVSLQKSKRMMHTRKEQMEAFGRFLDVLDELREKCPWDRKQTNESLRPNTIEETYELCDALMKDDKKDI